MRLKIFVVIFKILHLKQHHSKTFKKYVLCHLNLSKRLRSTFKGNQLSISRSALLRLNIESKLSQELKFDDVFKTFSEKKRKSVFKLIIELAPNLYYVIGTSRKNLADFIIFLTTVQFL